MVKQTLWQIVLWAITLFTVFIVFFVYNIGQGRWQCTEWGTDYNKCNKCETEGVKIIVVEVNTTEINDVVLNWTANNPDNCICTEYEKECVKEVWTRKEIN